MKRGRKPVKRARTEPTSSRMAELEAERLVKEEEPEVDIEAYGGENQALRAANNDEMVNQGDVLIVAQEGTPLPEDVEFPVELVNPKHFIGTSNDKELEEFFQKTGYTLSAKIENMIAVKREPDTSTKADFLKFYGEVLSKLSKDDNIRSISLGYDTHWYRYTTMQSVFGKGQEFKKGMPESKLDFLSSSLFENTALEEMDTQNAEKAVAGFLAREQAAVSVLITREMLKAEEKRRVPGFMQVMLVGKRCAEFGKYQEVMTVNFDALTVATFQCMVSMSAQAERRNKRFIE